MVHPAAHNLSCSYIGVPSLPVRFGGAPPQRMSQNAETPFDELRVSGKVLLKSNPNRSAEPFDSAQDMFVEASG